MKMFIVSFMFLVLLALPVQAENQAIPLKTEKIEPREQNTATIKIGGNTLKGLVFETEEWSEPKDAWLEDKDTPNKWNLWSKEENVWQKRSKGKSLKTPVVKKDRVTPEEGAPPLHTRITGIAKGFYKVFTNATNRRLAFSFDGGKTWEPSQQSGENFLGFYQIDDGVFELWVDDRYANPEQFGPAYYDYIRFEETEPINVFATEPISFTLPDGSTQISWISSSSTPACIVECIDGNKTLRFEEEDENMRNHRVVLTGLTSGKKYTVKIRAPLNRTGQSVEKMISFTAGAVPTPPQTVAQKIKLTVVEPTKFARKKGYVTSGVPFAKGTLAGSQDVVLQNESGQPVEAQFDVMNRWEDGSVQWLVCDFVTETNPEKPTVYFLVTEPKGTTGNTVKRGIDKRSVEFILKSLDSEIVLADGTKLIRHSGETVTETEGSVRTSVRCEGDYVKPDGTPFFRWRVHASFFGNDFIRIRWTLGNNTETADHTAIRSAGFSIDLPKQAEIGKIGLTDSKTAAKTVKILQDRVDHAVIDLDNKKETVKQFNGFLRVGNRGVWMRDFWQSWPKGMAYENHRACFDILPELPKENYPPENWTTLDETFMHYYWFKDGCYLFKRGMEIQSEVWFVPDEKTSENVETCAAWLAAPLFAAAEPTVYCDSGVFPPIKPRRDGVFDAYEKAFDTSFGNLEKGRKQRDEYGWMNFGDWFGERRWNWGNNEYDLSYVCAMHFARSGNLDFLRRAEEMARHYTTVDVNFYPRTPRTRELVYAHSTGHVGGFVQKEDPRLESEKRFVANLRGGPDNSGGHCHQPGNFYMACLTGDKRFFEVAAMVCMNQAKYYTPAFNFSIERSAGWSLTNAVMAYHFTRNPFYLNAADIYFEKIAEKQNP
ncbi:MAG: hypothetical protein LBI18_05335, partial [Planctomycetaceae bacterium]|nr:hypothetical protein [Planctomycetaceae bacterium]